MRVYQTDQSWTEIGDEYIDSLGWGNRPVNTGQYQEECCLAHKGRHGEWMTLKGEVAGARGQVARKTERTKRED